MTNPTWQKPELIDVPKEIGEAIRFSIGANADTVVFKNTDENRQWCIKHSVLCYPAHYGAKVIGFDLDSNPNLFNNIHP